MDTRPSLGDRTDFENADRGFIGSASQAKIRLALVASQSLDGVQMDGDRQALATLIGLLDDVDRDFDIVTP
ncbi:alkyl sulfatase C-terminal domain-containing protein [Nonomuraea sp. NPDC059194]|uniref:alkyl sulfatase C-terminal domain-containing protein n=1 Tax=Nonomuraea sp. NPDC059194 TaxID=3346764 RepID=UPI0036C186DB